MKLGNSILWGGREIDGRPIPSAVRVDLALFTARGATAAALLLAIVLPTVAEIFDHGRLPAYDPELAVLTATLIAIIWTAYHTFQLVHQARVEAAQQARRLRETAVALRSSLVAELEEFQSELTRSRDARRPDDQQLFPREQISRALAHPELFRSTDMAVLAKLDYMLRQHLSTNDLLRKALKETRKKIRRVDEPETRDAIGDRAKGFEQRSQELVSESRKRLASIVEIALKVLKEREFFSLRDHVGDAPDRIESKEVQPAS